MLLKLQLVMNATRVIRVTGDADYDGFKVTNV